VIKSTVQLTTQLKSTRWEHTQIKTTMIMTKMSKREHITTILVPYNHLPQPLMTNTTNNTEVRPLTTTTKVIRGRIGGRTTSRAMEIGMTQTTCMATQLTCCTILPGMLCSQEIVTYQTNA